jgi:hypothetical protein
MLQNAEELLKIKEPQVNAADQMVKARLSFSLSGNKIHSNTMTLKHSEVECFRENLIRSLEVKENKGYLNLVGSSQNVKDFIVFPVKDIISIEFQIINDEVKDDAQ